MQHMQHNNRKNLTKKHRISAVCSHFLIYQLSKTRMKPSMRNVLKVTISPSMKQKLSKVSFRKSCDVKSLISVKDNEIISENTP